MPTYKNGNYLVTILNDGTKIRQTKEDEFIPAFSENCDMKITDKCTQGCPFCYEGCTTKGKHGDLFAFDFVHNLHPFTELALNGNDMDHPQLKDFLELLKKQHVYANITINQNQFISNYKYIKELQENGLIHGIGISIISGEISNIFLESIKSLKNVVLHTIVGILTKEDINILRGKNLKILLLGYKDLQRGINYRSSQSTIIDENTKYVYENLKDMTSWFNVVSFDNLAITQLDVKRIVPEDEWDEFYMGDDGGYTFYIDMVKGEFSKNSIASDRYPIGEKTIDEMFQFIKNISNE